MSAHAHLYGCQMGLFHTVYITAQNTHTHTLQYLQVTAVLATCGPLQNLHSFTRSHRMNICEAQSDCQSEWWTHSYGVQYLECLRLGFLDSKNSYPFRKAFEAFSLHSAQSVQRLRNRPRELLIGVRFPAQVDSSLFSTASRSTSYPTRY